ncbi:cytokine-like protein 1 [Prionailurus iriomotensis]
MTPGLLPLLLLLLAGPPAAQPAPPTCYSRMLSLSREVTGDAQRLQAMEPSVIKGIYSRSRLIRGFALRGFSYLRSTAVSRGPRADDPPSDVWSEGEACVRYLPRLYLDIHNYCVLAKLRDFVASPQCWKVAQVDALKDKVRKLYTIMNSFCRRDLVFLSDDCDALEYPVPVTTVLPGRQR